MAMNNRAKSRRSLGLRRLMASMRADAEWLVPCALAMGLCQALMFVPLVLGPSGTGLGATLWWDPVITMTFFLAIASAMAADELLVRRAATTAANPTRADMPFSFSMPQAALFAVGQLLLAIQGIAQQMPGRLALGCVAAMLCGWATASAQLSSARFLASLKPGESFEVVLLAQVPTATIVLYALLAPNAWWGFPLAAAPIAAASCIAKTRRTLPYQVLCSPGAAPERLGGEGKPHNIRAGVVVGCTVALASLTVFVSRNWFDLAEGKRAGGIDFQGLDVAEGFTGLGGPALLGIFLVVSAGVFMATLVTCQATKTLSLTFVFRIAIPPIVLATVLVALAGDPGGVGLTACGAGSVLCLFSLAFVDQMAWVLSAGFTRAGETFGETAVTSIRTFEFAGATVGAGLIPPLAYTWGVVPTLFTATAVLLAAFVICIPTYEPRLVSPGGKTPSKPDSQAGAQSEYALIVARFDLTAREAETLCLLADGADAAEVARRLCVSLSTANTHIRHIYAKLGVHSRQELLAFIAGKPVDTKASPQST